MLREDLVAFASCLLRREDGELATAHRCTSTTVESSVSPAYVVACTRVPVIAMVVTDLPGTTGTGVICVSVGVVDRECCSAHVWYTGSTMEGPAWLTNMLPADAESYIAGNITD